MPPSTIPGKTDVKKKRIPFEIKNAQEWNLDKNLQMHSDSDSEGDDYWNEDREIPPNAFTVPPSSNETPGDTDNDGFQIVTRRPKTPSKHTRPRSQPRRRAREPPRVTFNYKKDNLARASFRKRQPATGKFILPKNCIEIEPNMARMYNLFEEMGVRFGSFIRPPQRIQDRELQLWGNVNQIEATKAALRDWLSHAEERAAKKPSAKDSFSKEFSSLGELYRNVQKKTEKEAAIQKYQQEPEAGHSFKFTGSFLWPVDEVKPAELLGSSLEALDPIRFANHCHITFDYQLSCFRILSNSLASVDDTLLRIGGIMKAYVALCKRPLIVNMIEPPSPSIIRKNIKITTMPSADPKYGDSKLPVFTGDILELDERNDWLTKSAALAAVNGRRVEDALRKTILDLPYYNGNVRMRVFFGVFALTTFRWPEGETSTPFEDFMESMGLPGTKGRMLRDLQFQKDAQTIMDNICNSYNLFQPIDNTSTYLEETAATFSAHFTFEFFDKPSIQLEVEMANTSGDEGLYEKNYELWTKLDRSDNSVPLELFTIRLGRGVSWKLRVSNEIGLETTRIDPKMVEFAESVKLKKIPRIRNELTGQRLFKWGVSNPSGMQPALFEQKTALKYRLVNQTEWIFEIARYDSYGNAKSPDTPMNTNWGATLWNTDWDSTFTGNNNLGIGRTAAYDAKLETFFPSQNRRSAIDGVHPGVADFLGNVQAVARCLDDIKLGSPK